MQRILDRRAVVTGLAATGAAISGGAAEPQIRFLGLGDWGRDGQFHQRDVAKAMEAAAAELDSQFVMVVGDNFYPNGVRTAHDAQWKTSFEDVYTGPHLQVPWLVALGNHDYHTEPQAQLDYARTSSRWRLPSRYYKVAGASFGLPEADFFCIDTTPLMDDYEGRTKVHTGEGVDPLDRNAQLAWLDTALGSSAAAWKIVWGHHTIRSGGSTHGDTPEMVARVLPILQKHGVQVYICGHDHDLQHIRRDGLDYILTGAGSQVRPVKPVQGTEFCQSVSGFTSFSLTASALTVAFRNSANAVLHTAVIKCG
jgi:acid phosphatase